jgi:hypothetical protein
MAIRADPMNLNVSDEDITSFFGHKKKEKPKPESQPKHKPTPEDKNLYNKMSFQKYNKKLPKFLK